MRYFRMVVLAVALGGCQSRQSDTPEVRAPITPSAIEADQVPAEPGTTESHAQSKSVEEELMAVNGTVVPNSSGGIKSVIFEGTTVTRETVDLVATIPELEVLSFSGTSVGDEDLELLGELKNLKVLLLGSTEVTDQGLVHLKALTKLQRLGLGETKVTDAGLRQLQGLKNLKILFLGQTQVTDQGMTAFRAAVPGCQIER